MDRETLLTRKSLLERAQVSRDAPAWDELLEYYVPFINKILAVSGLTGNEIDDARQVVLLKFWKGLERYTRKESQARFRDWLFILIRNVAFDFLKKRNSPQSSLSNDIMEEMPDTKESEFDQRIMQEWQQYIVEKAVERLKNVFSGKAFAVMALSMQGRTSEEIATELEIRISSVYVLKNRVKSRLQDEIATLRFELEGTEV